MVALDQPGHCVLAFGLQSACDAGAIGLRAVLADLPFPDEPADGPKPEVKPADAPKPPDNAEPKVEPKPEPPKQPIDQPPDRKPSAERKEVGAFASKDAVLLTRAAAGPWTRAWIWSWPVPSRRSRKEALPWPRRAIRRPATR